MMDMKDELIKKAFEYLYLASGELRKADLIANDFEYKKLAEKLEITASELNLLTSKND